MTVLEVRDVSGGYGAVQILSDVSLSAAVGEVTCLFGPNGCGKSTLLKSIAGALPLWGGTVTLDGTDLTGQPSHKVLSQGIALMPQGGGVFPGLSVKENLRMGGYTIKVRRELDARIEEVLDEFPRLRERLSVAAGSLSGGEQMLVSIARALILQPRFLLFDEPSAGLSPKLTTDVLARTAALAERGIGVLMIEQNIKQALRVADKVYVLVGGRNRYEGRPGDINSDKELMHLYLGVHKDEGDPQ
ncbi:ABC transporter ATP-binding protein [Intrasporangium chromatireducens Q5-1]|uniref:ABC transporter ATP-binding protein n=1 Tax=Intrasporangium chromatireducens Q5-1 TaxID=584657 RepID=W9GJW4_9MICO|nr:ABC transporter ATP-binding protein [Intrasporangium chromatireducens]EWT06511.1 ABC transporter ATP-binding protein [Intrasporangium chromatireducens Q5-1]